MKSLSKKRILIVGSRRVQNELLASYLESETGATCGSVESFQEIEKGGNVIKSHPVLVLLDCFGMG